MGKITWTERASVEELVGDTNNDAKATDLDRIFSSVDSRTLKKIKLILSLTPEQRHMVYAFVDSLLNKNTSGRFGDCPEKTKIPGRMLNYEKQTYWRYFRCFSPGRRDS